jgi:hypothetical protein
MIENVGSGGNLTDMTSVRANAYRRVLDTLRDVGPAKLWPAEQACIREAADALFFCRVLFGDGAAKEALGAVVALGDSLIDSERWTPVRTQRLLDDVWACGPREALNLSIAA